MKFFIDVKKEEEWLANQKGCKLVHTNGIIYKFEECHGEYNYEYIFFEKSKNELEGIKKEIVDEDIEFVCNSSEWALFRKDKSKGSIQVFVDNFLKYNVLKKKYSTYQSLGACYLCIGSSQFMLHMTLNNLFAISATLFYLTSGLYFTSAYYLNKYALDCDDGSYEKRMKKNK